MVGIYMVSKCFFRDVFLGSNWDVATGYLNGKKSGSGNIIELLYIVGAIFQPRLITGNALE